MISTLFPKFVKSYFASIVATLVKKINGEEGEPQYYYKGWFKKKFDPTLKYQSLMTEGAISAADVVATDSPLPLKMRDTLKHETGEIPKIGIKFQLREGEMNIIDIMMATNGKGNMAQEIAQAIFADVKKVIHGFYARIELMALESLSQGYTSITNANNVGLTEVITYNIPSENQYGAAVVWATAATATPLDDLESIVTDAVGNGHKLRHVLMDRTTFNNMRKTTQVKERYAAYLNLAGSQTITPTIDKVNTMLTEDLGLTIQIIESYVNTEKNGVRTNVSAWKTGRVVLLRSMDVGSLYYGQTAEEKRPVSGVSYQKADDFILISKFAKNEPLAEFTAGQAYVIPVLNDVEAIYQLNANGTSW